MKPFSLQENNKQPVHELLQEQRELNKGGKEEEEDKMVGEVVHGGLGDRADHREVKDDAQDHHHQVEDGEGDRPAGLKSFCLELVLKIGH